MRTITLDSGEQRAWFARSEAPHVLDLERYPDHVTLTLRLLQAEGYITPHRKDNVRGFVLPPDWDVSQVLLLARYGRGLRRDAQAHGELPGASRVRLL